MIPTQVLERVSVPGGEMVLSRHGKEFSIRVRGVELMNSRSHDSEDDLGVKTAERVRSFAAPRMMIGGLGLGYTLRAALDALPAAARVEVVELIPAVVRWNRTIVGGLARDPLDDPRVTVIDGDVTDTIANSPAGHYHAIAIDVDNGPDQVFAENAALYKRPGLAAAYAALAPGGVYAVWSAFESPTFTRWLTDTGFTVELARVRPRGGAHHYIWYGQK